MRQKKKDPQTGRNQLYSIKRALDSIKRTLYILSQMAEEAYRQKILEQLEMCGKRALYPIKRNLYSIKSRIFYRKW